MTNNAAVESFEIERKYDVSESAAWPEPAVFAGIGMPSGEPSSQQLRAIYFDTPTGELAALRMALRHRIGGKDEGWHLKQKSDLGARELLWPTSEQMPAGVRAEIEDRLGAGAADRLVPIATLHTRRVTEMLFDASGEGVIELADDRVDACNELTGASKQWREWEAELMPDADPTVLDLVEPLLVEVGAVRAHGTSKIQRTMQQEVTS